eukprot:COSAG01_NODE_10788_length_2080_cov_3.371530_1_plen_165_part_10
MDLLRRRAEVWAVIVPSSSEVSEDELSEEDSPDEEEDDEEEEEEEEDAAAAAQACWGDAAAAAGDRSWSLLRMPLQTLSTPTIGGARLESWAVAARCSLPFGKHFIWPSNASRESERGRCLLLPRLARAAATCCCASVPACLPVAAPSHVLLVDLLDLPVVGHRQ